MTRSWSQIVASYEDYEGGHKSIRALGKLARRINESQLSKGLFAWTSMFDLCIVQIEVSYPFHGPYLRISPISEHQVEFRYIDTYEEAQQWNRTVDAEQAFQRLIKFLDQLRWFPADVLIKAQI